MSEELFPAERVASDSPRLRWLKQHALELEHFPDHDGVTESPESGQVLMPWVCRAAGRRFFSPQSIGAGMTADEACADLAVSRGLKLWNETP